MATRKAESVDSLYAEHRDPICRYVARQLPAEQSADAEDVVHEAFIRAYGYLQNGNHIEKPRDFLRQTARNLILDQARKKSRQAPTESVASFDDDGRAQTRSAEDRAIAEQRYALFCEGIKRMPPMLRQAFVGLRILGESRSEIAAALEITPHSVSNYALRGWSWLEDYFARHGLSISD